MLDKNQSFFIKKRRSKKFGSKTKTGIIKKEKNSENRVCTVKVGIGERRGGQGCQVQKIKKAKFGHKQFKKAKYSKLKKCQMKVKFSSKICLNN